MHEGSVIDPSRVTGEEGTVIVGKARNRPVVVRGSAPVRVPRALAIVGLAVVAVLLLAACSSGSESPAAAAPDVSATADTAAPTLEEATATVAPSLVPEATETPVVTAPTTVPTQESADATPQPPKSASAPELAPEPTPPPELSPIPPVSEVTYDQQKELLSTLVNEWYSGQNNLEIPRLKLPPDVRDNRRGGILIHIEINGDEYDSYTLRKAELDRLMRDTYEVIYGTGYEVTEVAITAIMNGTIRKVVGGIAEGRIQAFRSRLRGDAAATVDWANKEAIDFNEIWDTVLLNVIWKRELEAEAGGGN